MKNLFGAVIPLLVFASTTGAMAQTGRIVFAAPAKVTVQTSVKPPKYTTATYDEIFSMNPDGSGVTQLTSAAANSEMPVWSPDQQYIAFLRSGGTLMVMRADGTGAFTVPVSTGDYSSFDWSPDGTMLIYSSAASKNDDIYVVPINPATGAVGTPVFFAAGPSYDPNWSPDGTKVAFDRYPLNGDLSSIFVHDVATGAEYNFSSLISAPDSWGPSWSPNSAMLAFQAYVNLTTTTTTKKGKQTITTTTTTTEGEVFTANADGSDLYQVTPSSGWAWANLPVWSPDGTSLAFVDGAIYKTVIGSGVFTFVRAGDGGSFDWAAQ